MLAFASFVPAVLAQEVEEVVEAVEAVEEPVAVAESSGFPVLELICFILFCLAMLAVLGHMIYENFIRKPLRTDYTVDEFKAAREAEGLAPEMSDDEIAICANLGNYENIWSQVPSDNEEPSYLPLRKKQIDAMNGIINAAVAAKPTDQDVVDAINEINGVMNDMMKRQFNGSKTIIIISIIVGAALTAIMGEAHPAVLIGSGLLMYLFASRTPMFVLIRKELKGRGGRRSFLTLIMGGLFASVAAAPTYKTITTYSDGSTTTETDNSATWFSLAITCIIAVMLAIFMWVIALINYVRNYWLYF